MRKICLVKVVIPEVVAYCSSQKHGFTTDYECPDCKAKVDSNWKCCPFCKAELDWNSVSKPSKEFKEFLKRL